MTKKTKHSYYLGLYDIDIIDHIDKNGINIYKKVDWRKSGNQEYFIMIRKKLEERENWYELNDKQLLHTQLIDVLYFVLHCKKSCKNLYFVKTKIIIKKINNKL